ncbi:MAG: hypothetical protein WAV16_02080 [Candidatus Moraniibacteriota bacterium]
MKNEPLFLPKGSVRAILILLVTGFLLASIWYQKEVPLQVIVIWAGAIGWYFGGKIDDQKTQKNE